MASVLSAPHFDDEAAAYAFVESRVDLTVCSARTVARWAHPSDRPGPGEEGSSLAAQVRQARGLLSPGHRTDQSRLMIDEHPCLSEDWPA